MGEASTEFSPQPSRWEENTVLGTVEVGAKHSWIELESRNHAVSMHVGEEGGRWATVRGNQSDRGDPPAPAPEDTWLRMSTEYTGSPSPIIRRERGSVSASARGDRRLLSTVEDATRALGFSEWTSPCFKPNCHSPCRNLALMRRHRGGFTGYGMGILGLAPRDTHATQLSTSESLTCLFPLDPARRQTIVG